MLSGRQKKKDNWWWAEAVEKVARKQSKEWKEEKMRTRRCFIHGHLGNHQKFVCVEYARQSTSILTLPWLHQQGDRVGPNPSTVLSHQQ